jgi:hypothetical protein
MDGKDGTDSKGDDTADKSPDARSADDCSSDVQAPHVDSLPTLHTHPGCAAQPMAASTASNGKAEPGAAAQPQTLKRRAQRLGRSAGRIWSELPTACKATLIVAGGPPQKHWRCVPTRCSSPAPTGRDGGGLHLPRAPFHTPRLATTTASSRATTCHGEGRGRGGAFRPGRRAARRVQPTAPARLLGAPPPPPPRSFPPAVINFVLSVTYAIGAVALTTADEELHITLIILVGRRRIAAHNHSAICYPRPAPTRVRAGPPTQAHTHPAPPCPPRNFLRRPKAHHHQHKHVPSAAADLRGVCRVLGGRCHHLREHAGAGHQRGDRCAGRAARSSKLPQPASFAGTAQPWVLCNGPAASACMPAASVPVCRLLPAACCAKVWAAASEGSDAGSWAVAHLQVAARPSSRPPAL